MATQPGGYTKNIELYILNRWTVQCVNHTSKKPFKTFSKCLGTSKWYKELKQKNGAWTTQAPTKEGLLIISYSCCCYQTVISFKISLQPGFLCEAWFGGNFFLFFFFFSVLGLRCCRRTFSCCGAWASHCSGFSCCGARALGVRASVVLARGL